MGCLSVPVVVLSQLYLHAHLEVSAPLSLLLWLALCCSATALASVHFGCGGVSDPRGPGLCEVVTAAILSQVGMLVQDGQSLAVAEWLAHLQARLPDQSIDKSKSRLTFAARVSSLRVLYADLSVMTFTDTLVVCFFFVHILHFLLHRLPYSFSSGEAVTVATLLSLLLTHACFSLLAHLLWLRGPESLVLGKLASWAERAMVLDISAASAASRSLQQRPADPEMLAPMRFYAACGSLIVGVIVLGLLWFRPFLLPFKRAQARARKQQQQQQPQLQRQHGSDTELRPLLAPVATSADQGAHRDEDEATDALLASDRDRDRDRFSATASAMLEDGDGDGERRQGQPARRKKAAAADSSSSASVRAAASRSTRLPPLPLRSGAAAPHKEPRGAAAPASASASASAPAPWSVPALHLWMVAVIFLVVYPYIGVEMNCEPFGFVLRFLFAVPPSDEEFYARQRRLRASGAPMDPQALPPSIALRAGAGTASGRLRLGALELDTALLTHSVRATILVSWCLIMALGVFLCAPVGTAQRSRKVWQSAIHARAGLRCE